MKASGTFDITMAPQDDGAVAHPAIGRMSIDKTFAGDLEGSSKGQLLSAGTEVEGSAAYVAIEIVTGTLGGRKGGFALQHQGVMTRGSGQLTVSVVPDSGTDELTGLSGSMTIDVVDGKHVYGFDYTLDA
jgi:hypothetical protein